MDEKHDIEESLDTRNQPSRLNRPDFFTRVAGRHLSRRDMVKASVVAGGLVWSAPMLLSSDKAQAQATR